MVDRFGTALDCVDVGFLPDRTLDLLPLSAQIGRTRVGGVDLNKPRIRAALAAVLALSASPAGFTVADLTGKLHAMTGQTPQTRQLDPRRPPLQEPAHRHADSLPPPRYRRPRRRMDNLLSIGIRQAASVP